MILRLPCGAKCLQDAHRVPAEMPEPSPSKRSFPMEALLPLEKETTELLRAGGAAVFSCAEHRQCPPGSRGLFVVPLGTGDSLFSYCKFVWIHSKSVFLSACARCIIINIFLNLS